MNAGFDGLPTYLLCLILVAFGGALFVIEGPYLTWLRKWGEAGTGWVRETVAKGLSCYTCQGFWWGALYAAYYWSGPSDGYYVADVLFSALLGSAASTILSYCMDAYLAWRKGCP